MIVKKHDIVDIYFKNIEGKDVKNILSDEIVDKLNKLYDQDNDKYVNCFSVINILFEGIVNLSAENNSLSSQMYETVLPTYIVDKK